MFWVSAVSFLGSMNSAGRAVGRVYLEQRRAFLKQPGHRCVL